MLSPFFIFCKFCSENACWLGFGKEVDYSAYKFGAIVAELESAMGNKVSALQVIGCYFTTEIKIQCASSTDFVTGVLTKLGYPIFVTPGCFKLYSH